MIEIPLLIAAFLLLVSWPAEDAGVEVTASQRHDADDTEVR